MIILGLTGSIGMGKSTAAKMFRALRVPVHCSDEAVHALLNVNGKAVRKVGALCPEALKKRKGKPFICRATLGAAAFHDTKLMKRLEALLHPMVRASEKEFIARARKTKAKLAVLDIPLLFETGANTRMHGVVVVTAAAKIQRARVLARPGMTPARFKAILAKQMPDKEKRTRADVVIDTGLGLAHTKAQLKKVVAAFS